jgi:hypothetical protein
VTFSVRGCVCLSGTFNEVVGATACSVCLAGTFNNATGFSSCFVCPRGTAGNASGVCTTCQPGTFADAEGSVACEKCSEGQYAPDAGTTACQSCPPDKASSFRRTDCWCRQNHFLWNNTCMPCPRGSDCADVLSRTNVTLASIEGWWRDTSIGGPHDMNFQHLNHSFYQCPFSVDACPSSATGECNRGYFGVLCGVCEAGWHNTGGGCEECVGTGSLMMWLFAILIVCGALFLLNYLRKRVDASRMVTAAQIFVNYSQVCVVLPACALGCSGKESE